MLNDAMAFWKALEPKVREVVRDMTENVVREERFEVVTPPDGEKIGLKQPFGRTIYIPYAPAVANAAEKDTVLVRWRGNSLSTALAYAFGDGLGGT